MLAAFPPECFICCKYRKREIWIGGRQLDAHMWFLCRAGARWKGIDQWWGSVYGFLEAPSKAAAGACWGRDVWSQLVTFEVGLRPKLLIEEQILLLHHWKLSFFNNWFQSLCKQRRTYFKVSISNIIFFLLHIKKISMHNTVNRTLNVFLFLFLLTFFYNVNFYRIIVNMKGE